MLLRSIVCLNDNYCTKGIQCTSCLDGYKLVAGTCVAEDNCGAYSYNSLATSTWSPTNCLCLDGYYFSSYLTCSRCHLSCQTCLVTSASNCATCYTGYTISLNTVCSGSANNCGPCSQIRIINEDTLTVGSSSWATTGSHTTNNNITKSCGSYSSLFGYTFSYLTTYTYTY